MNEKWNNIISKESPLFNQNVTIITAMHVIYWIAEPTQTLTHWTRTYIGRCLQALFVFEYLND